MKEYDVIVVGAGNGGLVAAATTAKAGYKTLLLEKHNIPGGCATSFIRGRFEFEPSLHELCAEDVCDDLPSSKKILADLGVKVDLLHETTLYRTICKDPECSYDVVMHAGRENFLNDIEAAVPGSREGVANLFDLVDNISDAQLYMNTGKNGPKINPFVLMSKYGDFMRTASHSTEEVEKALGISEKARSIINTYWGYLGVPTDDLAALHFISLLVSYCVVKPTMPYHRSHEISLALAQAFEKLGGEMRYNSEVTRFLFDKKGKAIGVVANGEELYAKKIISNVIPNNVINRSEEKKLPTRFRKMANARKFGMSFVTVYLGLDRTKEELGIEDYSVFITRHRNARVQFDTRADCGYYVVNCLNVPLPDSTPKGTSTLFFTIPYIPGDFPENLTAREYKEFKNSVAEKYIKDYEETMGISIRPYIEEIAIASPVTFARYLSTPEGAIYGYASEGWDNIVGRIAMEKMEFNIPNLYFCGGHHTRGDGFPSGYITGDMTARQVLKDLEKEGK
ncbi:MAG TPA: NAD(P)/FAD-dependent oxidoreductase [Clostridiales bacterium]|nr:NAD(P)/FAD-dependent oxidoreductase [Clostridiales bacterium]